MLPSLQNNHWLLVTKLTKNIAMKISIVLGCFLIISYLQCSSWAAPTANLYIDQLPVSNVTKRNADVINDLFNLYTCRINRVSQLVRNILAVSLLAIVIAITYIYTQIINKINEGQHNYNHKVMYMFYYSP